MDGVAPKQHGCITFAKQLAGVAGGMPGEIDCTHAGIKALTRRRTYRSIRNNDLAPYDSGSLNRRCRHSYS